VPFGNSNHEIIVVSPLAGEGCRVTFN